MLTERTGLNMAAGRFHVGKKKDGQRLTRGSPGFAVDLSCIGVWGMLPMML